MMQRNARLTLAALLVVTTLPVVASYLMYYWWPPGATVNYGELLTLPQSRFVAGAEPVVPVGGAAGEGARTSADEEALAGRWTLVFVGPAACAAACEHALYAMRQARLAQGKEMGRVERVWWVSDGAAPEAQRLAAYAGMRVQPGRPPWLEALPAAGHGGGHEGEGGPFYLVDPLGTPMMRFPPQADIQAVIDDLRRLLKYSGLG